MTSSAERATLAEGTALLISIKPTYATSILLGEKTIELRRTKPSLALGSTVVIYASSPTMAVVGWATLSDVIEASPDYLWRKHGPATGIDRRDYRSYFDGASRAFGLRLSAPVPMDAPLPLDRLRDLGMEPPQSWRYLSSELVGQMQSQTPLASSR